MYTLHVFNLTPRTQVRQVRDAFGKPVANFPINKPKAAASFVDLLNREKIRSVAEWLNQPWRVQRDFIFVTGDERPTFWPAPNVGDDEQMKRDFLVATC